jgi:hypothetical protein
MTPPKKAESLINTFRPLVVHDKDAEDGFEYSREVETYYAKQCALIVVDEIEQALTDYGRGDSLQLQNMDSEFRYLEQVKQEIQNG